MPRDVTTRHGYSRWRRVAKFAWNNRKAIHRGAKNLYNRARNTIRGSSGRVPPSDRSRRPVKRVKRSVKIPLDNVHSGVNTDKATITLHSYPKLGSSQKWAGTWTYTQTHSQHLTSNIGKQGITLIAAGVTKDQCITSTGPGYSVYQNNTALEQLNPYLLNTGSAFIPAAVNPLNDRFFVHTGDVEVNITNFSGVSVLCEMYVVTAKKANASDPVGEWNQGYVDDGFTKVTFTQPALGSVGGQATGSGNAGFVGSTPTETSLFKGMWKIHHRHKFEMAGGASYQHHLHFNINKIIKKAELTQLAGTWITGTSYAIFVVHRGVVALDAPLTGATVANSFPVFAPTELGVITNVKTRCQAIAGNAARLPVAMYSNETATGAYTAANLSRINVINTQDNPEPMNSILLETS